MRFKVTMLNDHGKFCEETIIANIENNKTRNFTSSNPIQKIDDGIFYINKFSS